MTEERHEKSVSDKKALIQLDIFKHTRCYICFRAVNTPGVNSRKAFKL